MAPAIQRGVCFFPKRRVRQAVAGLALAWSVVFGISTGFSQQPPNEQSERPGLATGVRSVQPKATPAEIRKLVQELGSEHFRKRDQATSRLLDIGVPAIVPLTQGSKSDDLEIRSRCRIILWEIEQARRQELIAVFLNSGEVPVNMLPGWSQFREQVADSQLAKSAYTSMMREEWRFVEQAVSSSPEDCSRQLDQRCNAIQSQMRYQRKPIKEGTLSALLFVAGLEDIEVNNPGLLLGFCSRPECQNYFIRSETREVLTRLLTNVLLKPLGEATLAQRIYLASRYGIPEGIQIAREVVGDPTVRTYVRQSAILTIARFGTEEDRDYLLPLLQDETVSIQAKNVQIRDIALAALIHLHGEDVREYGFSDARRESMMVFSASTLGFKSETLRARALALWRERHGPAGDGFDSKKQESVESPIGPFPTPADPDELPFVPQSD